MKKIYRGMQNSAEDIQANFDELDSSITKTGKVFYSGASFLQDGQSYPINMNEIKESLILVFSRFDGNALLGYGYCTFSIPKQEIMAIGDVPRNLGMVAATPAFKQVKVSRTAVTGHADNAKAPSNLWVLEKIIAN